MEINWNQILPAIIAVLGTLSGVFISEYFRRKDRESLYSETIFKKKLDIYEKLIQKLNQIRIKANELIENKKLSKDERNQEWGNIIIPFAKFIDDNDLYINENIQEHTIISIVGVDDIPSLPEEKQKAVIEKFHKDVSRSIEMIREDAGLKRLDKFFRKINKPNLQSDWIDYIEEQRKKMSK